MTMVERVARAIATIPMGDPDVARVQARAAIAAMREPIAALEQRNKGMFGAKYNQALTDVIAMIDAALTR